MEKLPNSTGVPYKAEHEASFLHPSTGRLANRAVTGHFTLSVAYVRANQDVSFARCVEFRIVLCWGALALRRISGTQLHCWPLIAEDLRAAASLAGLRLSTGDRV